MIKNLERKFILTAMISLAILVFVLLGGVNVFNAVTTFKDSSRLLENLASPPPAAEISEPPDAVPPPGNMVGEKKLFDHSPTENDRMRAVFFTVTLASDGSTVMTDLSRIAEVSEEEAAGLAAKASAEGKSSGFTGHYRYRTRSEERNGEVTLIFIDISNQFRALIRVALISFLIGIVCLVLMFPVVIFLTRKVIAPIADNIKKQKTFVTDAGHELKTPLAIILANTEAMELYQGESKWSRNIREQTVRLSGLMQNLLTLAKADEEIGIDKTEEVDLSKTVTRVTSAFAEPMALRSLTLKADIAENLFVKGDGEQLERVFSVLIDNAVKYASEGTEIEISLTRAGRNVCFTIENRCDPLPDCPPEKLFDRFYRSDKARTQKNGGCGIGLSAAKAITELHSGTIKAEITQPDKIGFTVCFPGE